MPLVTGGTGGRHKGLTMGGGASSEDSSDAPIVAAGTIGRDGGLTISGGASSEDLSMRNRIER